MLAHELRNPLAPIFNAVQLMRKKPLGDPQLVWSRDVIARLNAAVVDALADGAVRQRLAQTGSEIVPREEQTPAALAALQKAEIAKWWPIVKDAGIKAE